MLLIDVKWHVVEQITQVARTAGWRPVRWLTRPAVGHRGVFPPQVRAQVTAIACSLPKQCQVLLARWSRAELARQVAHDPTLPRISASTVGRWLKAERLRPWRYHAWQHIHDPHTFVQRARPVLEAYVQAQALLQAGTWLVSLDEKTSIQAREGEQPPRPACSGPFFHCTPLSFPQRGGFSFVNR